MATAMMAEKYLNGPVLAEEWADASVQVVGTVEASQFLRLMEYAPLAEQEIEADQLSIHVNLQFSRDDRHRIRMRGDLKWSFPVVCQRCLEVYQHDLLAQVDAVLTDAALKESVVDEADDVEQVVVANLLPSWVDVLEDDLLLALPLVVKHEVGECKQQIAEAPPVEPAPTQRPFEKLAQLYHQNA